MSIITIAIEQNNQSLQLELDTAKLATEPPLSEAEMQQMQSMQGMLQGEIAEMQALLDKIDPEQRDEYQGIIAQLQSGNATLSAAISKPTPRNINAARGVLKNNAYNAASLEGAILTDDIANKVPQQAAEPQHDYLSDSAFQLLQTTQVNMERKIGADDILFQHADAVLEKNGAVQNGVGRLDDAMLEEMLMLNALQALPYEHRKVISAMSGGDSSPARLAKTIDGFISEGLVSVQCLNEACAVVADASITDDLYARQIIAVSSMVTALQVGKMLVSEYMELELRKQQNAGIDFVPKTSIATNSMIQAGLTAEPPALVEQWFLQKPNLT